MGLGPGFVTVAREGALVWVTLDRPPLNLIVPEMIEGLRVTFEALRRDATVRAAVITGAGRATTGGMQLQVLRDLTPGPARAFIASLHPMKRMADAKEIAQTALFLLSDRASFVTGSPMIADGGMSVRLI